MGAFMKNIKNIAFIFTFIFFLFSCATNQTVKDSHTVPIVENLDNQSQNNNITTDNAEDLIDKDSAQEYTKELLQNTQIDYSKEINNYQILYQKYQISKVSVPSFVTKGSSFKQPYIIIITDKDNKKPVADFSIAIQYPKQKNDDGSIIFDTVYKRTDYSGKIYFTPPPCNMAIDSQILFYIENINKNDDFTKLIMPIIETHALKLDFKVKTNLCAKGGNVALVDFSLDNKPLSNTSVSSSALLMAMYKLGFSNVGNSSNIVEAILTNDVQKVYEASKSVSKNNYYLVYGTIKLFDKSQKLQNGKIKVSLICNITCLDMQKNKIFFTDNFIAENEADTEELAISTCKKNIIAPLIAEKMLYGM